MAKRFSNRLNFFVTENDTFMIRRLQDLSPGQSASEVIRQAILEKYKRAVKASPIAPVTVSTSIEPQPIITNEPITQ